MAAKKIEAKRPSSTCSPAPPLSLSLLCTLDHGLVRLPAVRVDEAHTFPPGPFPRAHALRPSQSHPHRKKEQENERAKGPPEARSGLFPFCDLATLFPPSSSLFFSFEKGERERERATFPPLRPPEKKDGPRRASRRPAGSTSASGR